MRYQDDPKASYLVGIALGFVFSMLVMIEMPKEQLPHLFILLIGIICLAIGNFKIYKGRKEWQKKN